MRTYLDCIPCFFRQALGAAKVATDDEGTQREVLDSVAAMVREFPLDITPPEIAQRVYRIVYDMTGDNDPYREAKQHSNEMALALFPRLKEIVESSDDPLLTACKLAIAGNSIDLAPQVSAGAIGDVIESTLTSPLSYDDYDRFRQSIKNASSLLYLADNAGEIVFDKLLIEELRRSFDIDITLAVRSKPIINDATMDDAIAVGLNQVATVIANGSDAPATVLSQCSTEFLKCYGSADVIISKGQGNYESLSGEQANIFFLLRAKCPVVAEPLNLDVGDSILKGAKNGCGRS
ncbi:MAG: ARMT1-like domain-containing protein [Chloroflexota bacterium]|nr:ARMT1-like domain-containing protein [Chloroflexota bacterium]